jgi:hypothetical protein
VEKNGRLTLVANLGDAFQTVDWSPSGEVWFTTHGDIAHQLEQGELQPWTAAWFWEADQG